MLQFVSKLLYLTKGHHKSLVAMFFTFLFISGLEVFGTGIIGPFIANGMWVIILINNLSNKIIYGKL